MKKKKPTMKEVKTVMDNALVHMSNQEQRIELNERKIARLDSVMARYIEYNEHIEGFGKWLEEKVKEESNGQSDKSSNDGGGENKQKV